MITVHRDASSKEVPLFQSPTNYTNTVSACIGPLYWFNDWIRLIIFVEYWKFIGVSKILLTPNVISKDVAKVIEYYKAQGIIETHGWPLLPFTEKVDPNYGVHYVSDNLDTQHCTFWSKKIEPSSLTFSNRGARRKRIWVA
ncbi:unnamed protein product, partial [Mesorhabditis belari]|uniref:Glycosyltransferase family 92 protein n=1 Tax=Mesorhabditis belari TaxID=2138241 RepID=A0AAF3F7S9_9BILA